MSQFHSTLSRRDFMKGLGLAGAGLGAAAASSPVFHDLDEVTSAGKVLRKLPWYVKERDYEDPTFPIDWSQVKKMDQRVTNAQHYSRSIESDAIYAREHKGELLRDYITKMFPNWQPMTTSDGNVALSFGLPGLTTRDFAMGEAVGTTRGGFMSYMYNSIKKTDWVGIQKAKTPEELGIPKWEATPEENLNTLRAFARFIGASDVGVFEWTPNTEKFLLEYDGAGKTYVFEDVDKGYEDSTKFVIPRKAKWVIVWTMAEPTETAIRVPTSHGAASTHACYTRMPTLSIQIQEFLRGLGYNGYSSYQSYNYGLGPSTPHGVMAGVGEHGRMCKVVISPGEGSTLRGMNRLVTDLPLAPTKPIDFGLYRFCKTCKKCAESCVFNALPFGDPSWDAEFYQPTGFEGYRIITRLCVFCMACQAVCPFTELHGSFIHQLVKFTAVNTTLFNGFFRQMDDLFGYGMKNPESWWDQYNEPVDGLHPTY
ncbi:dehalogenase [Dehalococcoides mccartyi CG1]|uniref:reductive dehalogenase n=1 Tax=Dehalococcoides mccartyi TaxID=61435 RepID=UPI0004E0890A|nr:reductive dehalogenase [Dehalococcoides mccartyi]AII58454.1 dehalogenase [Dehalococcoides mccartyi CG1]